MSTTIIIYSKAYCPYCDRAKDVLQAKGLHYEEVRIDLNPDRRDEMIELTQRKTVPQIIIEGKPIGGFDDMVALIRQGQFDVLLKS